MRFTQKYLPCHPLLPTCSPLGSVPRHLLYGICIKTAQQSNNMLNLSIFKMPPEPSFLNMAPQVPTPPPDHYPNYPRQDPRHRFKSLPAGPLVTTTGPFWIEAVGTSYHRFLSRSKPLLGKSEQDIVSPVSIFPSDTDLRRIPWDRPCMSSIANHRTQL